MNENKSWYALDFNRLAPLMVTLAFILVLIQYSFYPLEAFFYDLWVKLDFTHDDIQERVVVVTLDDESDMFLGETYPYSYATHVRLLNRITKDKPGFVNYFVNLLEPDSEIESRYQDEFADIVKKLLPPDKLKNLGYSLSTLNRDSLLFAKDDVVRRAILTISGEDSLHLWTAKKYRESQGLSNDQEQYKGTYYSPEADANFVLFKYLFNPIKKGVVPTIPFHRVVVGHFPENYFTNKIVLIGPQYLSNGGDYVLTPFDKENVKVSKLTVHANIMSSLINKQTIVEVRELYTKIAALIVSLILSLLISRVQPLRGLVMTVTIITAILFLSYVCFLLYLGSIPCD
jgi:CHASE2 domain-containing sensor protein